MPFPLATDIGVWSYRAGSSGTVTVPAGVKCTAIAAHATTGGSNGTVVINGGDSIPVPAGAQINIQIGADLVAPTIVFTTTDSFFVELLT